MTSTDPKAHFQKVFEKDAVAALGDQINAPFVRTAMVFAKAEMAHQGCTAEQLRGAIIFESILLSFHTPQPDAKQLPIKSLKEPNR